MVNTGSKEEIPTATTMPPPKTILEQSPTRMMASGKTKRSSVISTNLALLVMNRNGKIQLTLTDQREASKDPTVYSSNKQEKPSL